MYKRQGLEKGKVKLGAFNSICSGLLPSQIVYLPYRAQLRPLLYLACVAVVCIFEHAILRACLLYTSAGRGVGL